MDWNTRNAYCSACGKRTVLEEAGHKRSCISEPDTIKCISHTGVQNFAYPRTGNKYDCSICYYLKLTKRNIDAVVIVCIIHPSGDKILLGRNKRWPGKMFSCISGKSK